MQGGRTWQPFVEGKNGYKNFRQASFYYFCNRCVVFAINCKFVKLKNNRERYSQRNGRLSKWAISMRTFFIVFVLRIQKKKSINITIGLQCDFVLKAKEDCWVIDFVSISWCPDRINVKEKLFLQLSWISSKRPESAGKIFCGFFLPREEVMTFLGPRTPPPTTKPV